MTQDAQSLLSRPQYARVVYDYPILDKVILEASGVSQISLQTLTADDELMAAERSNGSQLGLAYELAKQSWCEVILNGETLPLNPADGSADMLWNDPKFRHIRTLAVSAYQAIHSVRKEVNEGFLSGCKARIR